MTNTELPQQPEETMSEEDVIRQVQEEESLKFADWQKQQTEQYLNTRVVELGIENRGLRERVRALEAQLGARNGTPAS